MTTIVCPYCFDRAPAARLPYRCLMTATGVRGGKPCDAERDDVWAEFMGPSVPPALRMRGPVFAPPRSLGGLRGGLRGGPGGGSRAACPGCGVSTPVRVCRRCHSDFPSDYCDQDSRIIALVGAKASGKSTYVSVLVNELRNRVGRAYDASIAAMGSETQRHDREMAEDLYDRLRLPAATRPAAMGFNDPLLYRLSLPRRRRLGDGSRHTALVFFDAAGEDLKSAEAMDRYTHYLGAADGIILLVDPLQLGSVRDQLPPDGGSPLPAVETPPQQIAADLAAQLRAHGRGGSRGRVTTPMAVAVTKTDMLRPVLGPHSPLLRNAPHHGGTFDEEDRLGVHEEMRSLMESWDSGALCRQLERDFAELSLFGLSALGSPPPAGAPADAPKSGPQPVRVEDPLLWLLGRRGLIPVQRPGKPGSRGVRA
ncbi:TRAFAC clade GTPase domain-containing protein [Streptomyces sp. NPDC003016]